jgi:IS5 family transposase
MAYQILNLKIQSGDRISFLKFLNFPDKVPYKATDWSFRERLIKAGTDELIWKELRKQLEYKGLYYQKRCYSSMQHS